MRRNPIEHPTSLLSTDIQNLWGLKLRAIFSALSGQHFSFWAICGYLFVEYFRPQSIIHALDVLPWAQLFILLAAAGWLVDPQKRWATDPTNKWMLLFQVVLLIASFTAYWPDISRKHFIDFFGWLVAYFLIINIVNSEKRFFIFLLLFLLASLKLAQHGARTWAMRGFAFTDWGLMGPAGFFQNSGELSIQMLMFAPIAFYFAAAARPWLAPWKYYAILLSATLGAMTIIGASSRGSQLALAFQLLVSYLRERLSIRSLVAIAVIGSVAWTLLPAEQKERFEQAGQDRTSQQRVLYWQNGIEMIKAHPILGVGYFNFPPYFERHYPEDMLYPKAQLPHNIFIQVGTDAGLLGLSIYLILIYRAFRSTRDVRAACEGRKELQIYGTLSKGFDLAFIGFLLAGQFVSVAYYPFMWIHLALVVALRRLVVDRKGSPRTVGRSQQQVSWRAARRRRAP